MSTALLLIIGAIVGCVQLSPTGSPNQLIEVSVHGLDPGSQPKAFYAIDDHVTEFLPATTPPTSIPSALYNENFHSVIHTTPEPDFEFLATTPGPWLVDDREDSKQIVNQVSTEENDYIASATNTSTFSCHGRPFGHYADVERHCQIYHLCNPITLGFNHNSQLIYQRISFLCLNDAIFDQRQMLCVDQDRLTTHCSEAVDFYASSNRRLRVATGMETHEDLNVNETETGGGKYWFESQSGGLTTTTTTEAPSLFGYLFRGLFG